VKKSDHGNAAEGHLTKVLTLIRICLQTILVGLLKKLTRVSKNMGGGEGQTAKGPESKKWGGNNTIKRVHTPHAKKA